MDDTTSDIVSNFEDYRTARELEGGLHNGGGSPTRSLLLTGILSLGLLVLVVVVIGLLTA
jgi:hypothetical protein